MLSPVKSASKTVRDDSPLRAVSNHAQGLSPASESLKYQRKHTLSPFEK